MPNALPRLAEPDETRYQATDIFSYNRGHHSFKVGGDANIVHEVMINLYQGGGLYSYSGTALANFQNWAEDSYAGQAGDSGIVTVSSSAGRPLSALPAPPLVLSGAMLAWEPLAAWPLPWQLPKKDFSTSS